MLAKNNIKPIILILCTGNSCRSQMAEGILRALAGDVVEVRSAGSKPAGYVHPLAIQAMAEIGMDITGQTSKSFNEFLRQPIETVITICPEAEKGCPVFPGEVARLHWPFDDPAQATGSEQEQMGVFRRVRDQMRTAFEKLTMDRRSALSAR